MLYIDIVISETIITMRGQQIEKPRMCLCFLKKNNDLRNSVRILLAQAPNILLSMIVKDESHYM